MIIRFIAKNWIVIVVDLVQVRLAWLLIKSVLDLNDRLVLICFHRQVIAGGRLFLIILFIYERLILYLVVAHQVGLLDRFGFNPGLLEKTY